MWGAPDETCPSSSSHHQCCSGGLTQSCRSIGSELTISPDTQTFSSILGVYSQYHQSLLNTGFVHCYSPLLYMETVGLVVGWAVSRLCSPFVSRGRARTVPAGPHLQGWVLAVLPAAAHLPGHCPTSPARYVRAGQQQCNMELSLPLASPVLPHPQMMKTPQSSPPAIS